MYSLQLPVQAIFAKNLRSITRNNSKIRAALCDGLEVAPQTLSGWENGKHLPSYGQLVALSLISGMSIDEMLGKHSFYDVIIDKKIYVMK
ncbi:MAG: XRE family transcriptional regulator [Firmicutes bacterium HGW-Firmicutes-16]|nr:MAG: XRE family transcriptional regulator [Firmicutes bacterium HGW-Firmicutes-16]